VRINAYSNTFWPASSLCRRARITNILMRSRNFVGMFSLLYACDFQSQAFCRVHLCGKRGVILALLPTGQRKSRPGEPATFCATSCVFSAAIRVPETY
jgi:hypothetical protein